MLVGVDIGGTFTDLVLSEDGKLRIHKLLSTPHHPAEAMLAGLQAIEAVAGARISHGSTVATNAILERKGARTALITTQGFRDVLEIGRQNRPMLYALHPQIPRPLIPREWRYEVPERLDFNGQVLTPLDIDALDKVLDQLAEQQIEAIAVCFLYSYVHPQHELKVRERILERGIWQDWQISLSCDVLPEFREYERTSTVALDAYVRPVMSRYLQQLEDQLPPTSRLLVMKSDGGVVSAKSARGQAVQTALSGPAAGVIGAFHIAQLAGFDHILTLDMGGTSTDVALCPGEPIRRAEAEIDGLPLRIRLIDIETVGAGGGSIARIDAGGALRVGPESAGAAPGPIIYGQGGTDVTVSDTNAILGRLDADHFLGGSMTLHLEPAQLAIHQLAQEIGFTPPELASGVIAVANTNIERALRKVSIERGYDPRDFTLMAFGGAGALHACEVAERLEMKRVLVPRYPGVLCALGLLVADVVRNYSQTVMRSPDEFDTLQSELDAMLTEAHQALASEGIAESDMFFEPLADVRYKGQSYELTVPFTENVSQDFHAAHLERYGYAREGRKIEIVNLRVQAVGQVAKPTFEATPIIENDGSAAIVGQKADMTLYDREKLSAGAQFSGAALIFQLDSTTYIPPHWSVTVDAYDNLILEHQS